MNPQRHPLPPLPVQLEMPARPELSSFSFSSRIGTPTLLARMGHGPPSSFAPFSKAGSLQQQPLVTPQHSGVIDAQTPDSNPLMAVVGDNVVNSTEPRGLQPVNSAGQTQPMDLDVVGVQLSPHSWGAEPPLPLNTLALNDLWADAERVQNEWASVDRIPIVPSLSSTKTRQKGINLTSVDVPPPIGLQPPEGHSTRHPRATTNESNHSAEPESNTSTHRITQECDIVKREELETRIKKEDDVGYPISSSIGRVTASAVLHQEPNFSTQRTADLQSLVLSQSHENNARSAVAGLPISALACLPEGTKTSSSSQMESTSSYPQTTLKEDSYRAGEEQPLGPSADNLGARPTSMSCPDVSHSILRSDNTRYHTEAEERLASTPPNVLPVNAYQASTHREGSYSRPSDSNTIESSTSGPRTSLRTARTSPMDGSSRSLPVGPTNYRGAGRPPRNQRYLPHHRRGNSPLAHFQRDPYASPGGSPGPRHVRSRSPSPRAPYQASQRQSESPTRGLRSISRGRLPPSMPDAERRPSHPVSVTTFQSPLYNDAPSPSSFSHENGPPLRRPSSDSYLRSPATSSSQAIGRGRTPHHFTKDSPPHASRRRSPPTGFSGSYTRLDSDRGTKAKLQEDRIQTPPGTPEGRPRYEPQHVQALKRNLVEAGLHDEASDRHGSATVDFTSRKRSRMGSLNRGNGHAVAIVADSSAPKEFPNRQARQLNPARTAEEKPVNHGSESSLKVSLWSRMAGNSSSSSIPQSTATVGLPSPEDLQVSTLAQPVDGIAKDHAHISTEVHGQNAMPTLRLREASDVGMASETPTFQARLGGLPLSERITHVTPGTHTSSKSIIPSRPRRVSTHRPNVPLVNRLNVPGQTPLPYTNDSSEYQGIPLVHRITDNAPVGGHSRSPSDTGRGAYVAGSLASQDRKL